MVAIRAFWRGRDNLSSLDFLLIGSCLSIVLVGLNAVLLVSMILLLIMKTWPIARESLT